MHFIVGILILCVFGGSFAAKFPSNLEKCEGGDTKCFADRINEYVVAYHDGLKALNLVPLDPLHIDEVNIIQGSESPVNVNLNFKNVSMFGLSKLKVYKAVGFEKDPTNSKFEIYAKAERLALLGQYKIKGKVIVLPVVGSGASNLTFDNVDVSIKFIPKIEMRKGKTYLQFEDVELDFTTTRLYINLANLFNGDKLLGATTNRFLNENWSDILNELKPVLKTAIGDIVNGVISPVFAKFPYDDLFL